MIQDEGMLGGRKAGRFIVAIDGPAGAGKSTVAKRLAQELGYKYLDTGAMYRAFAWKVVQAGIDSSDEVGLERILEGIEVELVEEGGCLRVHLNGRDVTDEIRSPELSQMASKVSGLEVVRDRMVRIQRAMGLGSGVVAEGRDIGTVVFPEADVKIYLDASPQERARRRFQELQGQQGEMTMEGTLGEMVERDRRDKERTVAPLCKAEDAIVIDSTSIGVDAVVRRIMREIKKKMAEIH
ncbi:MAG: (d)CMP kinase [Candidatus Binatia bacterium]